MLIEAIQKEVEQFDTYYIFKKADPVGHAMKTKLVFTVTFKSDYTLKYKARLFLLLFLAGWGSHRVSVFDVTAAFLEGEADCVHTILSTT